MVCQHYWPEHFQITEVCEELVSRGNEVTALVGVPNYPTGVVPEEYRDGRNRRQEMNGVNILRCEEVPRRDGVAGLARNYLSYALRAGRMSDRLEGSDYDVVFAYQTSPVLMAAPAARFSRRTGVPMVTYCADIWPDAVKALLPAPLSFLMPAIRRLSTRIYSASAYIATNSEAYVDCFEKVHGMPRERLVYMPQYAEDSYLGMDLEKKGEDGRTHFAVIGNIGKLQDMGCVMEAVRRLSARGGFVLDIVGTGSRVGQCEEYVREHGLGDLVVFHGRHPFDEMPSFYRMADACLLTLNVPGAPWISSTLPSRLQGYMAAGKPVLAAIDGSAAKVIEESGCGRAVPAGDAEGLAGLMADFMDDRGGHASCGEAGRAYFRGHFMKERYMDDIEALLERAAGEVRE